MPLIVKYADTTNDKVRKAMANGEQLIQSELVFIVFGGIC